MEQTNTTIEVGAKVSAAAGYNREMYTVVRLGKDTHLRGLSDMLITSKALTKNSMYGLITGVGFASTTSV